MTQEELKERSIELYEWVAIQAVTPNQAREKFMQLINQHVAEVIGEDEKRRNDWVEEYAEDIRNDFRAEQRKRAGL